MARPKKKPEAAPEPPKRARGRPKSPGGPKLRTPIAVSIRANPAWEAWLDDLCGKISKSTGLGMKVDRTDAVDIALLALAEKLGVPGPPPRY